jgi:transcriptional regulator of aromatic amino acid metabolism
MTGILSTSSRTILTRERVEYASKIYNSTRHAAEALGVAQTSIARACRKYGIQFGDAGKTARGRKKVAL